MSAEESNPDTKLEEVEPDWVNHWHENDDKKEPCTRQTTF
jgi:hypothetical protein